MSINFPSNPSRIVWRDIPQITPAQIKQAAGRFMTSLTPLELRAFNGRIERGIDLAMQPGAVCPLADPFHTRRFSVRSSDGFHAYLVDLDAGSCDCPDALKGHFCKHRLAAIFTEQVSQAVAPKKSTEQVPTEPGF